MRCGPSDAALISAAGVAAAGLALLPAACGGSQGRVASRSAASAQESAALAFSRCLRSHRISQFPDPNGSGESPKETPQQLGVSDSELQAAERACQHLLPNGGQPTRSALRQSWSDFRGFARCMRRRGVPNWPDPTRYAQHP